MSIQTPLNPNRLRRSRFYCTASNTPIHKKYMHTYMNIYAFQIQHVDDVTINQHIPRRRDESHDQTRWIAFYKVRLTLMTFNCSYSVGIAVDNRVIYERPIEPGVLRARYPRRRVETATRTGTLTRRGCVTETSSSTRTVAR